MPGGSINHERAPEEGAARELREEVGLHAPLTYRTHVVENSAQVHNVMFVYTAELDDDVVPPIEAGIEIAEVRWAEPAELWPDLHREVKRVLIALGTRSRGSNARPVADDYVRDPRRAMAITDWNPLLRGEFDKPYWKELQAFVAASANERPSFPTRRSFRRAAPHAVRGSSGVSILGQDPYHGPGQAHGLCFSVRDGTAPPPSLVNIFKEMESDLGLPRPTTGSLEPWARQGVLLLNAVLTVRAHQAGLTPTRAGRPSPMRSSAPQAPSRTESSSSCGARPPARRSR